jgi:hypothetical protein
MDVLQNRYGFGFMAVSLGYFGNISPVLFENRTLGLNSGVHQT